MSKYPGQFIVLEGADASGKTTTIEELKRVLPGDKVVYTREPGGSKLAEIIRNVILHHQSDEVVSPVTETYLFAAARTQHIQQTIIPALKAGKTVICDRFLLSSLAYQTMRCNQTQQSLTNAMVSIMEANKDALFDVESGEYILPDKTIYFDITPGTLEQRMHQRGMQDDKDDELVEYQAKVDLLQNYQAVVKTLQNSNLEDCLSQHYEYLDSQTKQIKTYGYQNWYDFAHNVYSINANKDVDARVKAIVHLIGWL